MEHNEQANHLIENLTCLIKKCEDTQIHGMDSSEIHLNVSYCNLPYNTNSLLLGNVYQPPPCTDSDIQLRT